MKQHKNIVILVTFIALLFTACSDTSNLESALQIAQNEAAALATTNSDLAFQTQREIAEISTRSAQEANVQATESALILAEAQGAAQQEIAEARATTEAVIVAATAQALPDSTYDTRVYGIIEDLDLNGVVVRWWHNHSGRKLQAVEEIVADFNNTNAYGIIIEPTNEGSLDTIFEKMLVGFATGDVPGLVQSTEGQMAFYQAENGLVSLDPFVDHPVFGLSEAEVDDMYDSILNSGRLRQAEDALYGVAHERHMELLVINLDLLDQLNYEQPPRTLGEWTDMACTAARNQLTGLQLQPRGSSFVAYSFASGNNIFNAENNTFQFDNSGLLSYMNQLVGLVDDRCAGVSEAPFEDQRLFTEGSTLFIQTSSENLPVLTAEINAQEAPFSWTVAPIPFRGYEPIQLISGNNLLIPESSPEEQLAAWLFTKHLLSAQQQARWVEASHSLPVRASTGSQLENYFSSNPAYRETFNLIKYGRHESPIVGYDNVRRETEAAANGILIGEENIEVILLQLNGAANQELFR